MLKWFVDLPSPWNSVTMVEVGQFNTQEEAIEFAKRAYGADDDGMLCLVSSAEVDEDEE